MKKVKPKKLHPSQGLSTWKVVLIGILCFVVGVALSLGIYSLFFLQPSRNTELAKFETAYDLLRSNWYYGNKEEDLDSRLIEQAISGMASFEEDHHTTYFDTQKSEAFSQSLAGSTVGIGALISTLENGHLVIKDVYINSASDQAGLKAGDEIVTIAGEDTSSASLSDWVERIRQAEGQDLEVKILRDGQEQTLTLVPSPFDSTVTLQILDQVGIIGLSSFSQDSGKDFVEAVNRLKEQSIQNLILDLRDNTGGYLVAADQIASILLPPDSVIFRENLRDGTQQEVHTSADSNPVSFEHIYILQNDKSASASEVLIGALKENMPDTVTTIGTTTFGKGTEQITLPFEDGTALKYTIAEWTTPNGTSVNGVGLKPDIEVSADEVYSASYIMPDESDLEAWIIRPDTVHPNAYAVQVYLRALGYAADRSDTYFSTASSEAFKQFQQDQGLEATGIVDRDSFLALTTQVSNKLKTLVAQDDPDIHQALALIDPTRYGQETTDSTSLESSSPHTSQPSDIESEPLIQPEGGLVETPLNSYSQEESFIIPMEEGSSIPLYS